MMSVVAPEQRFINAGNKDEEEALMVSVSIMNISMESSRAILV